MNYLKAKRLLRLFVISVFMVSMLTLTAFAGSAGEYFDFDFDFWAETQYDGPAEKTDATDPSGGHADVYVTQHTVVTYSIRDSSSSTTDLTNTVQLSNATGQQHAVLTYLDTPSNGLYYLFGKSPLGRYGTATGTWYP